MTRSVLHFAAATLAATLVIGVLPARAADPTVKDVTSIFAGGVSVAELKAVDVGGILVLRGRVVDRLQAEAAGLYAQSLGYSRVANLIQITSPVDDAAIERNAERALARRRSFEGCRITIASVGGVVQIRGEVRNEMQKDMAVQLVRNVEGVKEVRSDLQRF